MCSPKAVCSKVDLYESPWMERQCRCPGEKKCSSSPAADDGFTLADKTRQYKMCEPIKKLPRCRSVIECKFSGRFYKYHFRYFRDITWTLILTPNNATEQIVHCHCPKNSVTYLIKRQAIHAMDNNTNYHYSFACSPQSVSYISLFMVFMLLCQKGFCEATRFQFLCSFY